MCPKTEKPQSFNISIEIIGPPSSSVDLHVSVACGDVPKKRFLLTAVLGRDWPVFNVITLNEKSQKLMSSALIPVNPHVKVSFNYQHPFYNTESYAFLSNAPRCAMQQIWNQYKLKKSIINLRTDQAR